MEIKLTVKFRNTDFDVWVDPTDPHEFQAEYNGMVVNPLFFDMGLLYDLANEVTTALAEWQMDTSQQRVEAELYG